MKTYLLFFALIGLQLHSANGQANPVALDVYYESLCPDTVRFFKNHLFPTWQKLKDTGILTVEIFPYGNAEQYQDSDGSWIFDCQHGVPECDLNHIHACIIKRVDYAYADYLPFILCNEMDPNPSDSVEACLTKHLPQLIYSDILTCAQGPEGNALMHDYGTATENLDPRHNYIPWMVVDDKHTDEIQEEAEFNLLTFICSQYSGEVPIECVQK